MGKRFLALAVLAAAWAPCSAALAAEQATPIGKRIDGFTAKDVGGKTYNLSDFADSKLVVVAFMGTECPLAKLYGPRLADLANEFQDRGVTLIAVDSNQQDSIAEIAHYARQHEMHFPVLKDVNNVIADQFGAIRTPEMFVLDGDRTIQYWGRVDDQFGFQAGGIAYQRNEPKRARPGRGLGRTVGRQAGLAAGHLGPGLPHRPRQRAGGR